LRRSPPPPPSESSIDPDASLSPAIKAELKKVEMLDASTPGVPVANSEAYRSAL